MSEEDLELLITTDDPGEIPWKRIPSIFRLTKRRVGPVSLNKVATRPANRSNR
jgi:hypothetical protein